MKKNYCLPIIRNKKSEVLEVVHTNITGYSYFEVWLDYIDDVDEMFIKQLMVLKEKLILLFRRQNLEKAKMGSTKKIKFISLLEGSQSFIDLDIFDQKEELEYIKNKKLNIKKIVSYHNYKKTVENNTLKKIVDTMNTYKPSIYKIATMCTEQMDALRLLRLLLQFKKRNLKYIVLGMGEFGIITRIFGSLWGNEMIFAPRQDNEQSAPGQLTKDQLEVIFNILKY
ncbi:hypothetical protein A3C23_02280 [Candidatus Roizmanbacteria bacterium RIFCSPHIGHO2_02_FULL_37_13b]|uniref:3-dehydroquinate dehydratase n=1 Tax=Candidatus Roizmanbacteria bacterium RIFCSPLOWO2_02_FULL_36_11 TaxID=1802071 RepID=A0A1F7JGK8_9BACT|nr:MAG: hypothetical protein A3C23_02280 [Candidatus Roizmanbacteria bacterium RIFCSPHIGHO2_02_FULL_37_13b]OGK54745.1 MAG: hypothetical protein A3H78_05650 [Candidatus Roizmanbacteria bacterium RIFCSPLOWO2_02_FULL_36_11]